MEKKRLIRTILMDLLIILANVFVFSNAFLGIQISFKNVLGSTFGIFVILLSAVLFILININPKKAKSVPEFMESDSSKTETFSPAFDKTIAVIAKQTEGFNHKKRTIDRLLAEKFDVNEITYDKYTGAVQNIAKLFQANAEEAKSKVKTFHDANIAMARKDIFQEYHQLISEASAENEEIILNLDKLILEISKLKDKVHDDGESMDAIHEIEQLIQNTKLYQ